MRHRGVILGIGVLAIGAVAAIPFRRVQKPNDAGVAPQKNLTLQDDAPFELTVRSGDSPAKFRSGDSLEKGTEGSAWVEPVSIERSNEPVPQIDAEYLPDFRTEPAIESAAPVLTIERLPSIKATASDDDRQGIEPRGKITNFLPAASRSN